MRKLLLLSIAFLIKTAGNAQIGPPPPPPVYVYAIDYDQDGHAQFDLDWLGPNYVRHQYELASSQDLSGYDVVFSKYYPESGVVSGSYTNINIEDFFEVNFTYNGTGPESPNIGTATSFLSGVALAILPPQQDWDQDGVVNILEDINLNGNPYDENTDGDSQFNFVDNDDDNDGILTINEDYNLNGDYFDDDLNANGIPDFIDLGMLLQQELTADGFMMYPNPADTVVNFRFGTGLHAVNIFDRSGKLLIQKQNPGDNIEISTLSSGIYLIQLKFVDKTINQKLIVR